MDKKITTSLFGIFLESGKLNESFVVTKEYKGKNSLLYCTATAARYKRKISTEVLICVSNYGADIPKVEKMVRVTLLN